MAELEVGAGALCDVIIVFEIVSGNCGDKQATISSASFSVMCNGGVNAEACLGRRTLSGRPWSSRFRLLIANRELVLRPNRSVDLLNLIIKKIRIFWNLNWTGTWFCIRLVVTCICKSQLISCSTAYYCCWIFFSWASKWLCEQLM